MIKSIFIILSILILSSCSFDTKSGIWTKEKIALNDKENNQIKELFKKEVLNENEFNPNLKVVIKNFSENKNKYNGNNFGALKLIQILKKSQNTALVRLNILINLNQKQYLAIRI